MSNLFKKANAFYFIASSLATLTSLALIVTSNLPPPLILALVILSALVLALSCKIISNNKKIEIERNKFARKEQELENKIALGKEVEEAASKETERLNSQLNKLIEEKQNLDREAKKLAQKVNESEAERESFLKEKESLEQKLEAKINRVFEITGKLEKITREKDELGKQEEELLYEITRLCEHLQEKEGNLAEKEKRITELKRKINNNKHVELKNEEFHKEIEKLSKEKEELCKEIERLCKEKHILCEKKEELHKRQKELYAELDELQCKIKEINQEKKNLSKKLEEKSEELRDANDCINDQSFELDGIRKDCNNEVKGLKNLLLEQDSQIEQLEEDLKKVASLIQRAIQHITREVEESIKRSRDDNIETVLKKVSDEVQVTKSLLKELKETAVQHLQELVKDSKYESPSEETFDFSLEDLVYASLPDETPVPLHAGNPGYESEEDFGYVSRSSTPAKLPDSLLTEPYERSQFNQSEGVCKT